MCDYQLRLEYESVFVYGSQYHLFVKDENVVFYPFYNFGFIKRQNFLPFYLSTDEGQILLFFFFFLVLNGLKRPEMQRKFFPLLGGVRGVWG